MITKSGWKTSEFWVTLCVNVVSVLVLLGYIGKDEEEPLVNAIKEGVVGVFAVISTVAYIWSRVKVKTQ